MPTSLVTGGAGFMGSHVAEHLFGMGHNVVVLDDLSGGFRENVPSQATFMHGSVMDHELIMTGTRSIMSTTLRNMRPKV
jgi:UDP-glucose 4-epimerase